jgi:hypothetical protein
MNILLIIDINNKEKKIDSKQIKRVIKKIPGPRP